MCNTRGVSGVSGVGCALFFFGGVLSVREGCAFSIIPTQAHQGTELYDVASRTYPPYNFRPRRAPAVPSRPWCSALKTV